MSENKFWTRKAGQSLNGQVKVMQVSETRFEFVFLLTERVLGFCEAGLDEALRMANEHEVNSGLAPKRSAA